MTKAKDLPAEDLPAARPPRVDEAEEEAREAGALAEALEERVRDGDDTVSPDQVAKARELAGFARLRVEAARRRADKAKQEAVSQQVSEVGAEARAFASEIASRADDVQELAGKAETVLRELVDALDAQRTEGMRISGALEIAESNAQRAGVPGPWETERCRLDSNRQMIVELDGARLQWGQQTMHEHKLMIGILEPAGLITTGEIRRKG